MRGARRLRDAGTGFISPVTHRAALGVDVASRARTNDWSAAAVKRCVTYGHPFPAGYGILASQKTKGSQCVVETGRLPRPNAKKPGKQALLALLVRRVRRCVHP
jgi:hypothetical protein